MSYWKLGYFPLQLYHLESRWRNSHVLVYHGPLLMHLLGVVPSTFQMVYFFWGIRANDANYVLHWIWFHPKKAHHKNIVRDLSRNVGGPRFLNDVPWVGQMVEAGTSQNCQFPKRGGFLRDPKKIFTFFLCQCIKWDSSMTCAIYILGLNSPLCNMIWFCRSFQIPLLYLQNSVLFLYHRGWHAPEKRNLRYWINTELYSNFRSIIAIVNFLHHAFPRDLYIAMPPKCWFIAVFK